MHKYLTAFAFVVLLGWSSSANAIVLHFQLGDHPDGAMSGSYDYGGRLDQFTPDLFLSFNTANGADMKAEWDTMAGTFRMYGTAVHSTGVGTSGDTFEIDYLVSNEGRLPTSGSSLGKNYVPSGIAGASWKGDGASDGGTAENTVDDDPPGGGDNPITLTPKQDSTGFAMDFYEDAYRISAATYGDPLWVGRGWLVGGGTNDFLFTGVQIPDPTVPVPEPTSLAIFGFGALGFLGVRRRRR